ncbi:MAG TPA: 2TM domain-containing protein [Gaiellaceae bacterium]|nr:2TM domain-containing protein [Gaiellaceae bacterium]
MITVPTGMLSEHEPATAPPSPTTPAPDAELRDWARKHVERVHKLERDVAIFLLGLATLTGVWALVEWQDNGAFARLSDNGNPGDWEPWILYVALVWGFLVLLDVLKVYFDRPTTEAEIARTMERLRSRR